MSAEDYGMADRCSTADDQMHFNARGGLTNDVCRDVITEGTGSRSRDGAEDLFLLAEYTVLPTYCDALHLHVIFLTCFNWRVCPVCNQFLHLVTKPI